ncbi:hypothetical protein Btru_062012 [Bulinus truncatus]|nr:hypothetical protein Btru_062012 [Bulinus truncatus]
MSMYSRAALSTSRAPRFINDYASVTLNNLHLEGQPIYKAEAVDPDEEFCRDPSGCSCSNVTYFIVSQDGDSSFLIDKYSGEIKVSGESYSLFPTYELKIGANDDGVTYDVMTVTITTGTSWDDTDMNKYRMGLSNGYSGLDSENFLNMVPEEGEQPHHRERRAAITLPSNVTFTLVKYGINQNITEIKVGHRIQFQLDILFPSGKTDMQVEIFTPDSDTIVMMLCNVTVTNGSNLAINGSLVPVLESIYNSTYNDRAIIALGTVNNNGADLTSNTPSTITVKYEAVMIENPSTVHNKSSFTAFNLKSSFTVFNLKSSFTVFNPKSSFTVFLLKSSFTVFLLKSSFSFPSQVVIYSFPSQVVI